MLTHLMLFGTKYIKCLSKNPEFNQAFDDFENKMFATDAFHAGFHELYLSGEKTPHHKKYNITKMLNEN